MRVPSAAPVRALSFFASVAAIAAAACTSPDRGDAERRRRPDGRRRMPAPREPAGGAVAGSGGAGGAGASGAAGTGAGTGGTVGGAGRIGGDRRPAARRAAAAARPAAAAVHPAARARRPEPAAAPAARPRARAAGPAAPPGPRRRRDPRRRELHPARRARTSPTRAPPTRSGRPISLTSDGAGGFLRVRRPNSSGAEVNSTVSEGIAYGMLLSVYADDQPTFDKLWQYSQNWLDGNGLMNWYIDADGTQVLGTGAASDADEDMAYALIVADARWGGKGSLTTNYIDLAKTQIGKIWQYEVDHTRNDVLKPGRHRFDGVGHQHLVLRARLLPRVRPRHRHRPPNWNNVATTQLRRHREDAERAERQRQQRPGPRLVDARPACRWRRPAPACRRTTSSTPAARRSGWPSTTAGTPSRARSPTCRRSPASTPASASRRWSTATT